MRLDAKTVAQLELSAGKTDQIFFDDSLTGFGFRLRAGARRRVRRSWITQYRQHGVARRALLGDAEVITAEQARAAARRLLAKVALGEDPQEAKKERRAKAKYTLRSLADNYLAAKRPSVRPRTYTENRRYLTGKYFHAMHSTPIDRITRRDVAACLMAIGRECGTVTASRARSTISSLFAWAMGEGLVESNPVIGTNQPKSNPPRDRVLDDAELAAVWHACRDDDFGRIIRLLTLTGQRRTEVGGMCWSELAAGMWTIPAARTKNHRQHTLPLSALAQSVIAAAPRIVGRDYLFGERGQGFTAWAQGKNMLDATHIAAKLRHWTLHDIRRSVATGMATLGVQPHIIEQVLNHYSGHKAGVAGVYNRSPYEREVRAALTRWANHVRKITRARQAPASIRNPKCRSSSAN